MTTSVSYLSGVVDESYTTQALGYISLTDQKSNRGQTPINRLFKTDLDPHLVHQIREATNSGYVGR